MFLFGHLGIGSRLVSPWSAQLPWGWILLGTVFPDLIDKPLYYCLSFAQGKAGAELGLISGTRTIGHTGLLLILLTLLATWRRSRKMAALVLGISTHLILDAFGDQFFQFSHSHLDQNGESASILALLFPFYRAHFAVIPFKNIKQHFWSFFDPYFCVTEAVGILILSWDYWKIKNRTEIIQAIQKRRIYSKLRKKTRISR